jgi:hypothetical protein
MKGGKENDVDSGSVGHQTGVLIEQKQVQQAVKQSGLELVTL